LAERNLASLIELHPHVHDHFDIHGERYGYPFIAAAVLRNEDAVRVLVHAVLPDQPGALSHLRSNLDRLPHGRNFQPPKHLMLFSFLADFRHVGILRYFLDKNSIDLESGKPGQTMLALAAGKGYEEVVNLLLEKGAELDRDARTPLSYAAGSGHEAVVNLLLEKGAELDSKDPDGRTPLSRAAGSGHEAVVNLLLEKGAELDSKDENGQTPLSHAANRGQEAMVKVLLEKGAELDSEDQDGKTPLSWAAGSGEKAVVKLLVEKGAELESRDVHGRTPLSSTCECNRLLFRDRYTAVAELLVEEGAELECKDVHAWPDAAIIRCI
jgi:ankyrin repeat protein